MSATTHKTSRKHKMQQISYKRIQCSVERQIHTAINNTRLLLVEEKVIIKKVKISIISIY